jgi:hypothetical protein
MTETTVAVSTSDYLWFVDEALNGMVAIVGELGDDDANRRPELPGANSPYAILTHCLGVMEFWGGSQIAGRTVDRDRDAEFVARGDVAGLLDRAAAARRQLETDLTGIDPAAEPERELDDAEDQASPLGRTKGAVLVHIYEELAQHFGQMQLTRDVLLHAR